MRSLPILALSFYLASCSTINTGVVDYRKAELPQEPKKVQQAIDDYVDTNCPQTGKIEVCAPLLSARLFRKNTSLGTALKIGDVFSIRLDHGFMEYVSEFPLTPGRLFDAKNPFVPQAEIVVLARAFEFSEDKSKAGGFVELAGQDSLNSARVVYYSPDVEHRQSLNFSNIPLYGPEKYKGNPVGIQLIVLELDRVTGEMRGLLDSLASLGQSTRFLGGGNGADALLTLGKSLLENNNDDIIFSYRFVLDHSTGANEVSSAPFEEGRYVLRRTDGRRSDMVWRNLNLDHNTGQLFATVVDRKGKKTISPYREETYFTLNVFKNTGAQKASYIKETTLSDLNKKLNEELQNRSNGVQAAGRAFDQLAVAARSTYWGATLAQDWETVKGSGAQYLKFALPDNLPIYTNQPGQDLRQVDADKSCALNRISSAKEVDAQLDLFANIAKFGENWRQANADVKNVAGKPPESLFKDAEKRELLRFVSSMLVDKDQPGIDPNLLDITAFQQTYITTPTLTADLQTAAMGILDNQLADNCEKLLISGQAVQLDSNQKALVRKPSPTAAEKKEIVDMLLVMQP